MDRDRENLVGTGPTEKAETDFSFQMERTSYKSYDLIYEEPGRRLVVYLEMSGVPKYDWVGVDTDFERWTEPEGEPIPEAKRREILERLSAWGKEQKIRIDIGPPLDWDAYWADYERRGWTVTHHPDGTTSVRGPEPRGWLQRIRRRFQV